jgi:hypothetical protein
MSINFIIYVVSLIFFSVSLILSLYYKTISLSLKTRQPPDKSRSINDIYEQEGQCIYSVTLRRLRVTMVTVE